MRYVAIGAVVTGLAAGLLWPGTPQPAQYAVWTVSQPHCAASEAGDLTTFRGAPGGPFRAFCGRSSDGYYWDRLPGPSRPGWKVCGPGSQAPTVYCPNVTDWRYW